MHMTSVKKMMPFWGIALTTALLAGCGGAQTVKPDPRGTLRFKGDPKDAHIEVDEVHLGPVSMFEQKGLLLRPGEHRVIVRAEGYFPEYRLVIVEENKLEVLKITLRPMPD